MSNEREPDTRTAEEVREAFMRQRKPRMDPKTAERLGKQSASEYHTYVGAVLAVQSDVEIASILGDDSDPGVIAV